jgi:hypothetical protein
MFEYNIRDYFIFAVLCSKDHSVLEIGCLYPQVLEWDSSTLLYTLERASLHQWITCARLAISVINLISGIIISTRDNTKADEILHI